MVKKVLGKGLGALLQTSSVELNKEDVVFINLGLIRPNAMQPRVVFDEEKLKELSISIIEKGIIQPIIVRRVDYNSFELIVGERRLRASKLAGLKEIPAIIKDIANYDKLEIALIENLQRQDLNPMEEATSYKELIDKLSITHEQLGTKLGKSRTSISNTLRLLKLPPEVQDALLGNGITEGHARTLLTLKEDKYIIPLKNLLIKDGISVRETEQVVQRINTYGASIVDGNIAVAKEPVKDATMENFVVSKKTHEAFKEEASKEAVPEEDKVFPSFARDVPKQEMIVSLESTINSYFNAKNLNPRVQIKNNTRKKEKGKIEINYNSHSELIDILKVMGIS